MKKILVIFVTTSILDRTFDYYESIIIMSVTATMTTLPCKEPHNVLPSVTD